MRSNAADQSWRNLMVLERWVSFVSGPEIAEEFGVSRQRVHAIIKRLGGPSKKELDTIRENWTKEFEKRGWGFAGNGEIIPIPKDKNCVRCGIQATGFVFRHKKKPKFWIAYCGNPTCEKYIRYNNDKEHRKRSIEQAKKYVGKRRKIDVWYRLSMYLRTRLYNAIRNSQKSGSAVKDLGCSIKQFVLYIENQFEDGMSWDNYGEWHLDHVLPLAMFDLEDRNQFLVACNWLNYQPMWAEDNLSKGTTIGG